LFEGYRVGPDSWTEAGEEKKMVYLLDLYWALPYDGGKREVLLLPECSDDVNDADN